MPANLEITHRNGQRSLFSMRQAGLCTRVDPSIVLNHCSPARFPVDNRVLCLCAASLSSSFFRIPHLCSAVPHVKCVLAGMHLDPASSSGQHDALSLAYSHAQIAWTRRGRGARRRWGRTSGMLPQHRSEASYLATPHVCADPAAIRAKGPCLVMSHARVSHRPQHNTAPADVICHRMTCHIRLGPNAAAGLSRSRHRTAELQARCVVVKRRN